jgi:hypothetical protein
MGPFTKNIIGEAGITDHIDRIRRRLPRIYSELFGRDDDETSSAGGSEARPPTDRPG